MGQTGSDFGAVPTKGLVDRVIREIDKDTQALPMPNALNKGRTARRRQALAEKRAKVLAAYDAVLAGDADEAELRSRLGDLLSPEFKKRLPL